MLSQETITQVREVLAWPIDRLIPYARNPRTHSGAQVAQIVASIRVFGFNNPILVDTKAGIIAGHGRLLAARKLQLKEVPVIVLDHLSETQKRAYIIADNQLALNAGWDDEMLRSELAALQNDDFDVNLVGFDDVELARMLAALYTGRLFQYNWVQRLGSTGERKAHPPKGTSTNEVRHAFAGNDGPQPSNPVLEHRAIRRLRSQSPEKRRRGRPDGGLA
jgi:hypothetical protein